MDNVYANIDQHRLAMALCSDGDAAMKRGDYNAAKTLYGAALVYEQVVLDNSSGDTALWILSESVKGIQTSIENAQRMMGSGNVNPHSPLDKQKLANFLATEFFKRSSSLCDFGDVEPKKVVSTSWNKIVCEVFEFEFTVYGVNAKFQVVISDVGEFLRSYHYKLGKDNVSYLFCVSESVFTDNTSDMSFGENILKDVKESIIDERKKKR